MRMHPREPRGERNQDVASLFEPAPWLDSAAPSPFSQHVCAWRAAGGGHPGDEHDPGQKGATPCCPLGIDRSPAMRRGSACSPSGCSGQLRTPGAACVFLSGFLAGLGATHALVDHLPLPGQSNRFSCLCMAGHRASHASEACADLSVLICGFFAAHNSAVISAVRVFGGSIRRRLSVAPLPCSPHDSWDSEQPMRLAWERRQTDSSR